MTILVIGSANLDHIISMERPLRVGETGLARAVVRHPGGKGANQAVAAARLSQPGSVVFVGCVGDDQAGSIVFDRLMSHGVDTEFVRTIAGTPTGEAYVSTFADGDNSIAVLHGANLFIDSHTVDRALRRHDGPATILVLQGEVGVAPLSHALAQARARGIRALLNLAPYLPVPPDLLEVCDPLVVNETEAHELLGRKVRTTDDALLAVRQLAANARSAVITLGEQGAAWSTGAASGIEAPPPVDHIVDTLGAGDAFVGAVAVALSEGASLRDAVCLGVRAGSFSVARAGAQSSYATRTSLP